MKLFKNRVFMTLLATDIIQQGAIWIRNLAIMFFVMDATSRDPLAISTLNFLEFLPMFLLTFVGGIIADRYNPKKLMILGDFLSAISFAILGFIIKDGYIVAIFAATLVSAVITQFSAPSSQKYIKEFVDEENIEKAIGISQMLGSLFYIVGPFIGSYFYFTFGMYKTIIIIAALFVVSLCLIFTLPNKEFKKVESEGFFDDVKLTFKYVNKKTTLKVFIKVFFVMAISMGIATNLDIFLVTDRLGLDESYYQFFSGVAGIGVIVGGGIYVTLSKKLKGVKVLYGMMAAFAFTVFFEGYSTYMPLTMALQFLDNVIGGILGGYVVSLMIKITEQEYVGKVNGLASTVMYFGIMIGTILSGAIMKVSSIVVAYGAASLFFGVCAYIVYSAGKKNLLNEMK